MYKECKLCRFCCSSNLEDIVSLGMQYVVDFVPEKQDDLLKAPLDLVKCTGCHLVQLKHSVEPDRLYRHFWYRSGINEQMQMALRDVVNKACSVVEIERGDSVLDIGSNDGSMLSMYPEFVRTVGIDPCQELVREASDKSRQDVAICGYFSANAVRKCAPYKAITAIAMFYDLEDPRKFLLDCRDVLHDDGVIIIQMNYLKTMLEDCAFDNISHEHLAYYSYSTLEKVVNSCGLRIVGAETNSVNGGSLRVYIMNTDKDITSYRLSSNSKLAMHIRKQILLREEAEAELDTMEPYKRFEDRIKMVCTLVSDYISKANRDGKKVYLYGASTRGTTLMQMIGIQNTDVVAAAERDTKKFGLKMIGSWVPIESEAACREKADVFLVLPWHFWEGISRREKLWMENGGTFLVPLPEPRIVTSEGEYSLVAGLETMSKGAGA